MERTGNELTLIGVLRLLRQSLWLFLAAFVCTFILIALFFSMRGNVYQSQCEIQAITQKNLLPDYILEPNSIVKLIMKSNKDERYSLEVRTLSPITYQLVASGPSAQGVHDFLTKKADQYLREHNKASDQLLKLYNERLVQISEELKQMEGKDSSKTNGIFDRAFTILIEKSYLGAKSAMESEAFGIKMKIDQIKLSYGKLISQPTLGNAPIGPGQSTKIIFSVVVSIFVGALCVLLLHYFRSMFHPETQTVEIK